jgi:sulfonate transport system permease protein
LRSLQFFVRPLFSALAQIPSLGWQPTMMLISIREVLRISIIASVQVTLNTMNRIRAVPAGFIEISHVFR